MRVMTKLRTFLFCLLLALTGLRVEAALFGGEQKAFDAASDSFRVNLWDRAESEFAQFVEKYPKSERLTDALLLEAQAQFYQKKYASVVALLTAREGDAKSQADEFLYWISEAQFQSTNYSEAATAFGKLAREFPASRRRLEAAVGEAAARAKLGEWPTVVELLYRSDSAFRQAALGMVNNEFVVRGFLLQAEAQLALDQFAAAEASLKKVGEGARGELEWRRRHMLCRALSGSGRPADALVESEGLMSIAQGLGRYDLIGESAVVRADLFEKLGQRDNAIGVLRQCLTTNMPAARQRQALSKITALALEQNQFAVATETLESYLDQYSNAPAADLALLSLGEVQLKQYVSLSATNRNGAAATASNLLPTALGCFDRLLAGFSNSPYMGKAQLNRGWVYWIERKYPESAAAFQAAVEVLPLSEDLAVAKFKLADALFARGDPRAALENYQAAIVLATNWPAVQAALTTPALYQSLQASLQATNLSTAEATMRGIVAALPAGDDDAVRSVLLVAQGYVDAGQPAAAQRLFREFVEVFPGSVLRPQAEMLIASVQEQQARWADAIATYDAWLASFPTNSLRPQVEFQRALDTARAGNETNALTQFTNFVVRFRTHELAPPAQWWVADHFFRQADYADAEINYKELFQTWTNSSLGPKARMMAGRAAYERRDYPNAIEYFTSLSSDTNCPEPLWVQAVLGYGGARMRQPAAETNKLERFTQAVAVFGQIHQRFPTNEFAAVAWGEIGNCFLQMAALEPRYYDSASNAYQQAMIATNATATPRTIAQAGLGLVQEKLAERVEGNDKVALLKLARDNYWDVTRAHNLRPDETADLFWRKEAGMRLLRVVEALQDWGTLVKLAEQLEEWFPPMRSGLVLKRERALKMISAGESKTAFDSP